MKPDDFIKLVVLPFSVTVFGLLLIGITYNIVRFIAACM